MAVERILLKTVYCFECQRFVTVLMDAMKCPKRKSISIFTGGSPFKEGNVMRMFYHSISSGRHFSALQILRLEEGRTGKPFSARNKVLGLIPAADAKSRIPKALFSRIAFSVFIYIMIPNSYILDKQLKQC